MAESIPGPVDGLTSVASDSEPVVMRLAKLLEGRESSTEKVTKAMALLEEAEPDEPNATLRNRISMSLSLLRNGPQDS